MDIKTFFGLNESVALNEMAIMDPVDYRFNVFLWKKLAERYGPWKPDRGAQAWPKGTSKETKADDMAEWLQDAIATGYGPSNPGQSPEAIIGALNWGLNPKSAKSKQAFKRTWDGMLEAGFVDDAAYDKAMQDLAAGAAPPKMGQVVKPKGSSTSFADLLAARMRPQAAAAASAPPPEEPPAPAEEPAAAPSGFDIDAIMNQINSNPALAAQIKAAMKGSKRKK